MKIIIFVLLVILTLVNIYFISYPLLKGEVNFFNDVARDFLLLGEIDSKKIMLIGPRSNVSGLFHGQLWSYLNYPVYKIASGNPVVLGWYWMVLGIIALGLAGVGVKKIFGILPAAAFVKE